MNILLTGGAGFIGRWVVSRLLEEGHNVWVLDDLSNGRESNLLDFKKHSGLKAFIKGSVLNEVLLNDLFNEHNFSVCYHLAASINVQDSIDYPKTTFENDTVGTFYLLEQCKKHKTKLVFMSTCMVYDRCNEDNGIDEKHPTKPASPYAGAKIAAENMVLSYYYAYGLPTVIVRPFNTYGPFQKTGGEGGVVAIFIKNEIDGKELSIYGDGKQTRDLLYVEDCARFVVDAGFNDSVNGEIVNAGLGKDISINELAFSITGDSKKINHVAHIHPQSEIQKLLCNSSKAQKLLGWQPTVSLQEGISRTKEWILKGGLK